MAQIKRCKSCRLWRPEQAKGTRPKRGHVCYLRLREMEQDGEKVLRPTLQMTDSTPGPHYMKHTGPGFVCSYYVGKHMPVVNEAPYSLPSSTEALISVDAVEELVKDASLDDTTDADNVRGRDQVRDGAVA